MLSGETLKTNGRVGMVIPAELFQVNHAAEARQYLSVLLDQSDNIQQEIVLLLGEKSCDKHGIRVTSDFVCSLDRGYYLKFFQSAPRYFTGTVPISCFFSDFLPKNNHGNPQKRVDNRTREW